MLQRVGFSYCKISQIYFILAAPRDITIIVHRFILSFRFKFCSKINVAIYHNVSYMPIKRQEKLKLKLRPKIKLDSFFLFKYHIYGMHLVKNCSFLITNRYFYFIYLYSLALARGFYREIISYFVFVYL